MKNVSTHFKTFFERFMEPIMIEYRGKLYREVHKHEVGNKPSIFDMEPGDISIVIRPEPEVYYGVCHDGGRCFESTVTEAGAREIAAARMDRGAKRVQIFKCIELPLRKGR